MWRQHVTFVHGTTDCNLMANFTQQMYNYQTTQFDFAVLYPRTIFTSECRTGIQSTLVNIVQGLTYIPGYKVSLDVWPKGIQYPVSTEVTIRREGYPANRRKTLVRSLAIMLGAIKSAHCLSRGGQRACCVFSTVVEFEEDWRKTRGNVCVLLSLLSLQKKSL